MPWYVSVFLVDIQAIKQGVDSESNEAISAENYFNELSLLPKRTYECLGRRESWQLPVVSYT